MCFELPLKTIRKKGKGWVMEDGRMVKVDLVGRVKAGDFLLCRQDLAVKKLSKKDARVVRQVIKGVSDELGKGD